MAWIVRWVVVVVGHIFIKNQKGIRDCYYVSVTIMWNHNISGGHYTSAWLKGNEHRKAIKTRRERIKAPNERSE